MHGLTCDLCGDNLLIDSDVRYRVRIEVFAAYDPLEVTEANFTKDGGEDRDLQEEMRQLISQMESMDPRELEDQVYRRVEYDLCPSCQRRFLKDPIGLRAARMGAQREVDES